LKGQNFNTYRNDLSNKFEKSLELKNGAIEYSLICDEDQNDFIKNYSLNNKSYEKNLKVKINDI
jgi:hypothetical protein